jgi:hypothetical protein
MTETAMIDDGILIPGWDCSNPDCRVFNGSAKEELQTCRCCGAPRPEQCVIDLSPGTRSKAYQRFVKSHLDHPETGQHLRAVYDNLTSVQERCSELLLENRKYKDALREIIDNKVSMSLARSIAWKALK